MSSHFVRYTLVGLMTALLATPLLGATLVRPVEKIHPSDKTPEGVIVYTVISGARVLFPSHDWTHIRGDLVEPNTRTSFTFKDRSFGRKYKEFFIWGFSVSEHQWARELNRIADQDEKQARFLREWIERALRRQEIEVSNSLSILYPDLTADQAAAVFYPIVLDPIDQPINIKSQTIDSFRFASVELSTRSEIAGRTVLLNTMIYVCGLKYDQEFDDWRFFTAMSHIPTETSAEQREQIRSLFMRTLPTLYLNK